MLFADTIDTSLTAAFAEYRAVFLASRKLAARTRIEYSRDVADLVSFLKGDCGLSSPRQVDRHHLDLYLAELDRRLYASETRRRRVAVIRSFCSFLLERRYVPSSPSQTLAPLTSDAAAPRTLSAEECHHLRQALRLSDRDSSWRDDAIIELILHTGITLSEATRLCCGDVQLPQRIGTEFTEAGRLHVRGTGSRERLILLPAEACAAINRYLTVRPRVVDPHLFITRFGRGMQPRAIERAVEKYLKDAAIANASVHTHRHTFAVQLIRQDVDLGLTRQVLGLNRIRQVEVYAQLAGAERCQGAQPTIRSLRGVAGSLSEPLSWREAEEIAQEDHAEQVARSR